MKIKIHLFFLIFISNYFSYCQNKTIQIIRNDSLGSVEYQYVTKYIKVEVTDSIHLEDLSHDYIVSINQSPHTYTEKDSVEYDFGTVPSEQYYSNKSKLEKYLKSKKYNFKHYDFDTNLINNESYYFDNYLINIKSNFKNYSNLIDDLNQFDFIVYEKSKTYYKDENKIEEILFEKLIKKAKIKASLLAKISNIKLGKIIQIDENTTSYINKFNCWYQNKYWKVRSIIVKYSIED